LTPHVGEFERLFGACPTSEARLHKAIETAQYYKVIIVLKGHYTAVIRPDGKVCFNSTGTPALATGGTGDVLTGVIAGLMAQGIPAESAAIAGVYIHGLAGSIAEKQEGTYGVIAEDVANAIGQAIKRIMK
jgi:NAD(P)H-hydrate epimerase